MGFHDASLLARPFTNREQRAIALLALPIDIAAHRMGISVSRFKQLSRAITRKFGAADTKGAIVCAVQAGWSLEVMRPRTPAVPDDEARK